MYNDNKHFLIHEIVFLIIRGDVYNNIYSSLYKRVYNDNKYFLIHENVFSIIQDDV